jgi:hypothetical protein
MSAFLYIDTQKNVSFVLSKAILKKELFLLRGAVQETSASSFNLSSDNLQLRKVFAKLNFVPRIVTNTNIVRLFKNESDSEVLSLLFSLNKSHFKAIVFLFYENLLGYDELNEIIKADFYTRNELLLRKFDTGNEVEVSLFTDFKDSLFGRYIKLSNESVSLNSSFSYLDSSSSFVTPDEYFAVKNILRAKDDFNSSVKWLYQNGIEINSSQRDKALNSLENLEYNYFTIGIFIEFVGLAVLLYSLSFLILPIVFLIGWAYINSMAKFREDGTIFGKAYKSYLTYLRVKSRTGPGREIKKDDFINYMMNTFYPEVVRLSSKLNDGQELPSDSSFSNLIRNATKRAAGYAISDPDQKPKFARIFDHLYYTFNNTNGYNGLASFNFDSFNSSSSFTLQPGVDFSYIDQDNSIMTPLKEILLRIFPSYTGAQVNDADYLSKLFLSRTSKDGTLRKSILEERPLIVSELNSIVNLTPTAVTDNVGNITIEKISTSSSPNIVGSSRREYMEEALALAIKKVDEVSMTNTRIKSNVILYGSYDDIRVGMIGNNDTEESIRKIIKDEIIAQTSNPADSATNRYNKHLADEGNKIFRIFFADLVYEYLSYLVDTTRNQFYFKVTPTSNSYKTYKVLKFIKHTFKLMERFMSAVRGDTLYKEFDFMLLSINYSLSSSLVIDTISKGLTENNVTNLFNSGENYRITSTGGGDGGVRVR